MTSLLAGLAIGAVALAAIAVGGCITFALKALTATNRAATAEKDQAATAVRLEVAVANKETEARRANAAERRADALDEALADAATSGPVDGAFDRLLSRWRAARAADGGGTDELPDAEDPGVETAPAGADDLMRPGD